MGGKWEFPGGKLESGESEKSCLERELLEELGMRVEVGERMREHVHAYETFTIRLIAYHCTFLAASYSLTDHDDYAWVMPEELGKYDLTEADVAFVSMLRSN